MPDDVPELSTEDRERFRREGHLLLSNVLGNAEVLAMRAVVLDIIGGKAPIQPVSDEGGMYRGAFDQYLNLGLSHPHVATLTHEPRLARIAGALMESRGVRLFNEDLFVKSPGAGVTPWHQDASVLPLEGHRMVTAWIPLQPVTANDGALRVVPGTHARGKVGPVAISADSQRGFQQLIDREGLEVCDVAPMAPGDVHFHDGYTVHGANANTSGQVRAAFAVHYFADGARITPPDNAWSAAMLRAFAPGAKPGERAESARWPLLYRSPP